MVDERHLSWDGCLNVRDLGGLPTHDGRVTRFGAVVRSDASDELSGSGWEALTSHGVRTIVDLRDASERLVDARRHEVDVLHVPVLDFDDQEFWREWRWLDVRDMAGFYRSILERWPERFAQAVATVAHARPGCVLVHCLVGRDRTGLVTAFLLTLAGVPRDVIVADYALSAARLQPRYDAWIAAAETEDKRERLRRENASDAAFLESVLDAIDVEDYLRSAGTTDDDIHAVRARLVERQP
jgi:protein-tyrosine phosphatase